MIVVAFVTAFFTRETTGWFLKHDKALISKASWNMAT